MWEYVVCSSRLPRNLEELQVKSRRAIGQRRPHDDAVR